MSLDVLAIQHIANGGMDFAICIPIDDNQAARSDKDFFQVFEWFIENDFQRKGRGIAKILAVAIGSNPRE